MYKLSVTLNPPNKLADLETQLAKESIAALAVAIRKLKTEQWDYMEQFVVLPAPRPAGQRTWVISYQGVNGYYITQIENTVGSISGCKISREEETVQLLETEPLDVLHEAWERAFEFRD